MNEVVSECVCVSVRVCVSETVRVCVEDEGAGIANRGKMIRLF